MNIPQVTPLREDEVRTPLADLHAVLTLYVPRNFFLPLILDSEVLTCQQPRKVSPDLCFYFLCSSIIYNASPVLYRYTINNDG